MSPKFSPPQVLRIWRPRQGTVLHGMASAVGANVAGHLLGVGGNHKLNLAGRSCTCELNLVSKILCFTTLKTDIFFDPKNGVTDTPFNGSIIETCESWPQNWGHILGPKFGSKIHEFFAAQLGFKSMVSQIGLRGKCRQSSRRRKFCEYDDQGRAL